MIFNRNREKVMDTIAIIVPCYNEQEVLEQFHRRTEEVLAGIRDCRFRYVFVNDGSRDGTLPILRRLAEEDYKVSYISFSRNFGKEAAMLAGMDYAECDAAVIMDADLQHPPEMIPEMIGWWRKGYDDVCAKRADRKDEGFIKRHLTNFFYKLLQKCSRTAIQRNVGDFRLLDRRCLSALRLMRESERYTKGLFTWVGFKKKEIPFHVQPRAAGKTTWNYWSLMNLALEGLTSFTTAPLRLASMFGVLVSFAAILYMLYVFIRAMIYGDPVAGYPTLLTVMLCLGGVQLLALGIIGEYLGRVFNESKHRPLYLVDEWNGRKMEYVLKPVPEERRVETHKKEPNDEND